MSTHHQKQALQGKTKDAVQASKVQHQAPDDRYPGTFFRIPKPPMPGKTAWSLV